jgi:hypothetical protein
MEILALIFDEAIATLLGRPSNDRICRWRRWITQDGWSQEDIDKYVPAEVRPYL